MKNVFKNLSKNEIGEIASVGVAILGLVGAHIFANKVAEDQFAVVKASTDKTRAVYEKLVEIASKAQ